MVLSVACSFCGARAGRKVGGGGLPRSVTRRLGGAGAARHLDRLIHVLQVEDRLSVDGDHLPVVQAGVAGGVARRVAAAQDDNLLLGLLPDACGRRGAGAPWA